MIDALRSFRHASLTGIVILILSRVALAEATDVETTVPLLAASEVAAHYKLAVDGSTSAASALRKYYAVEKHDFKKSAEWAFFAYVMHNEKSEKEYEKNRLPGEAPYAPSPIPFYFRIPSDIKPVYEEAAYNGNFEAINQLTMHYKLLPEDEKLAEYWSTVGMFHGNPSSVEGYWVYIDDAETEDERGLKVRLVKWTWQKFAVSWSEEDQSNIRRTYKKYDLVLD